MKHRLFRAALVLCVSWMMGLLSSLPAAAQSNDLFVIDAANNRVLRYNGSTGVFLNVFIPPGSGGLQTPQTITVGPDNNLYVSSWSTGSVKRYDRTTGAFLGDFVASGSGGLANPDQVIFGPDGNLYVSDRFEAQVLRYDGKTGAFLDTFVQDDRLGGFVAFRFGPDGNLYASMFNGNPQCILRFSGKTGAFLDVFTCAPDSSSAFGGIAFGPDNRVYASRFHKAQVWQLDSTGHLLGTLQCPGDLTADYLGFGSDGRLYLNNQNTGLSRFDVSTGKCLGQFLAGGAIDSKGFAFFPVLLSLRVAAAPTPVKQGQLLTYTFPVWNMGSGISIHEVLTTHVPAGTTMDYIRISGTPGLGTCTQPKFGSTAGMIVCHENSAMAQNTTWTLRITVVVTAPPGTIITESATATADNANPQTVTIHNTVEP